MVNLVVGATGFVGSEICRLLIEKGRSVRALVRETSNPEKVARLKDLGATLVTGDLKDRRSIDAACRGAGVVLSTASSTFTRQAGDSIGSVDRQGQLDLVDAAASAGVEQFVFTSFPPTPLEYPLQSAKRAVEDRLRESGMTYTILQPTFFTEVWLSPVMGFEPAAGRARVCGAGTNKISWISFLDVARFAALAPDTAAAKNSVVPLGGPDTLSALEIVRMAEQMTGKRIAAEHIPEDALRAQFATATDPFEKSFAALMLYNAAGHVIDMSGTRRAFGLDRMRSVAEHLGAVTSGV